MKWPEAIPAAEKQARKTHEDVYLYIDKDGEWHTITAHDFMMSKTVDIRQLGWASFHRGVDNASWLDDAIKWFEAQRCEATGWIPAPDEPCPECNQEKGI